MINSQRKGMDGEREVVDILRAHGFSTAKRTGCYAHGDILCAIDSHDRLIEVKREKRGRGGLWELLKSYWAVIHRGNHEPWLITMELREFLKLASPQGEGAPEGVDGQSLEGAPPLGSNDATPSTLTAEQLTELECMKLKIQKIARGWAA